MKKFVTILIIALAFSLVALSACEPIGNKDISVQKPSASSVTPAESAGDDSFSGSADNSASDGESGAISPSSASNGGAADSQSASDSAAQSGGMSVGGDYSDSETWYPL